MVINFWKKLEKPILALAPMAGITDSAFRQLCKSFGADVVYSEMISADGLFYQSKKTLKLLEFQKKENPLVIQLFGKRPEVFKKAAEEAEKSGAAGIDINFGCPARKVVAHGGGVTLMRDFTKSFQIISNTLAGTKLPVSIKIRTSINDKSKKITSIDFLKRIIKLPIAAVMIHGRSYEQGFSGPVDYSMIKKIKSMLSRLDIIVLGNGGINTPEEAEIMLKKTNVDGVGLARGTRGKPWLFKQIKDYLKEGKYKNYSWPDIKKIIIKHANLAFETKEEWGLVELRKHLAWYVSSLPGAAKMRKELVKIKSIKEIKKIIEQAK